MKSDRPRHRTMRNRVKSTLWEPKDEDLYQEEHRLVAILRLGAKQWNRWRDAHPDEPIDLTWVHIEGIDLAGANLSEVILDNACLRKANLTEVNLQGASLKNTDLRFADLRGSELVNADFTGARSSGAILPEGIRLPSIGTGIIEKA